jgi:hypothetical protein
MPAALRGRENKDLRLSKGIRLHGVFCEATAKTMSYVL